MKKKIKFLTAFLLFAATFTHAQVVYHLANGGNSHLYWPFGNGTSYADKTYTEWGQGRHYCEHLGSQCHDYSDYYAQDWWASGLSNCSGSQENVLGHAFYSPVYGRVMFVDGTYNSGDSFGCQVIIEVMDQFGFFTGHALRVIHLESGSVQVSDGQFVSPGTHLADVGNTGPNSGYAHAHIVLYKRIDTKIPAHGNETGRYRLERGWSISDGPMCDDGVAGTQNDYRFATPFVLDAQTSQFDWCSENIINLGGTIDYLYRCEALSRATVNGRITNNGTVQLISPVTTISNLSVEQGGAMKIKLEQIPQKTHSAGLAEVVERPQEHGLEVYPNPFAEELTMAFEIDRETDFSLEIFDLTGRKVRTVAEGRLKDGLYSRRWDGKIDGGARAPAGQYLVRLLTPDKQFVERVSLLP